MKVLFVASYQENIGLEYLSSYLIKNGHTVKLFFDPRLFNNSTFDWHWMGNKFNYDKQLIDNIKYYRPDIVGFSVGIYDFQWGLKKATIIKNLFPNLPIVFGGYHPTFCPEAVIDKPQVDALCIAEGEEPLLRYLENFKKPDFDFRIPNFWFKVNGNIIKNPVEFINKDLDKIPIADKDIYYSKNALLKKTYKIATSRGCVFRCSFCYSNVMYKIYGNKQKIFRRRSIENVIAELEQAKLKYRPKRVAFIDGIFTIGNTQYIKGFLKEYKNKIDLEYCIIGHCKFLNDEICRALKESGCTFVEIGLQSACYQYRKKYLYRYEKNSDYIKAADSLHKYKLSFSIDHIFGMPLEKKESYKDAVIFYNKLRPSIINPLQLQYFPNTDITNLAKKVGIIDDDYIQRIKDGYIFSFYSPGLGMKQYFGSKNGYGNYAFWMSILPLIPKKIFSKLFLNYYLWPQKPGNFLLIFFRILTRIKANWFYTTVDEIIFHLNEAFKFFKNKLKTSIRIIE